MAEPYLSWGIAWWFHLGTLLWTFESNKDARKKSKTLLWHLSLLMAQLSITRCTQYDWWTLAALKHFKWFQGEPRNTIVNIQLIHLVLFVWFGFFLRLFLWQFPYKVCWPHLLPELLVTLLIWKKIREQTRDLELWNQLAEKREL